MNAPIRCATSALTTRLLQFRNTEGQEANWVGINTSRGIAYYGKVVVTAVGTTLLCVASIVEALAYSIFTVASLPICLISKRPLNHAISLLSSSSFTIYWNFTNTFLFNPFFDNLMTDESFARYIIDNNPSAQVFKIATTVALLALSIIMIFSNSQASNALAGASVLSTQMFDVQWTRQEDTLYIADWVERTINQSLFQDSRLNRLNQYGQETNRSIAQGTDFFYKNVLNNPKISPASLQLVLEGDSGVFHFGAALSVYLCASGSQPDLVPTCFKPETQTSIQKLKKSTDNSLFRKIEQYFYNHDEFTSGPSAGDERALFNELKEIAAKELSGTFVSECWQKAVTKYKETNGMN